MWSCDTNTGHIGDTSIEGGTGKGGCKEIPEKEGMNKSAKERGKTVLRKGEFWNRKRKGEHTFQSYRDMYPYTSSSSNLCLFEWPIITHKPWTDWPKILMGELDRTTEMFLDWTKTFKLSGLTFIRKTLNTTGFPNYGKGMFKTES